MSYGSHAYIPDPRNERVLFKNESHGHERYLIQIQIS